MIYAKKVSIAWWLLRKELSIFQAILGYSMFSGPEQVNLEE
jgi:hypothetical protein